MWDCLGQPVDCHLRWRVGGVLHGKHVPIGKSMHVGYTWPRNGYRSLYHAVSEEYWSEVRRSALAVRNAAEDPMLTHVGRLDFFSRGRVPW